MYMPPIRPTQALVQTCNSCRKESDHKARSLSTPSLHRTQVKQRWWRGEAHREFHPSSAMRTFWIAVSTVNGGSGCRGSSPGLPGNVSRAGVAMAVTLHRARGRGPRTLEQRSERANSTRMLHGLSPW